ncbi:hypothetical protein PMAYCL1PPCAC_18740, partial [Pristionchus mayeri]
AKMDVDQIFAEGMDQLEHLPDKVVKSASEIRELDIKVTDLVKKINIRVCAYAKSIKKMTREQKNHHISEIEKMYVEAGNMSRSKVALATELYDSVDQDISMMDKTTKKLEAGSRRLVDEDGGTSDGCRRKKKKKGDQFEDAPVLNVPVVEMPVDPNEPVYCTCNQVSFGEMVCCDNPDCKVEWFHFQCVGMTAGPPQHVKWFCEICRPAFKQIPNQWNYETNEPPAVKKNRKSLVKGNLKDE